MRDVTVIIPTARRANLLPVALRSVAVQTAVARIARVVVSENSEDRASRDVCRRFAELPVEYITQTPPVTPVQHLARLFGADGLPDYVAMLCDDDWWAPAHLQLALAALEAAPHASAAFSAVALVDSERAVRGNLYLPAAFLLGADGESAIQVAEFDRGAVLASAWVHTPFHFSAMVARSRPLRTAAGGLGSIHPYIADQMLFAELSLRGPIRFVPQPGAFIRRHAGNYDQYTVQREMDRAREEGLRRVEELAAAHGESPAAWWKQRLAGTPGGVSPDLANLLWNHVGPRRVRECGLEAALGTSRRFAWVKRLERATWQYAKPWLPPILLEAYRRFRDRAARRPPPA
ncbi:MAG: glycosyltransferase [Verrucomicrobia bacterium]|nr:glycosyltransferase [Verrucomicrobiota bacterium]